LAQIACDDKSNEITAIPEVLKLLSLHGCTVTIDAMGCQTEIASQIRQQGGHYVLALKGNQSGLEDDMGQLYEEAVNCDFAGFHQDIHETHEKGHGREEQRICEVIEIPKDHPQRERWKDLRTLVMLTCCRIVAGVESWETRLYVAVQSVKIGAA